MVAYHETGHALVSALQKHSQPVQKITIVPRTLGALGYTMNMPEEERYLLTKDELLSQITTLLGGRSAEEIEFNTSSTGASNDIERATKLARSMVTQYGMSDKFGMMTLESTQNQYLDGRNVFTGSEASSAEVDTEVEKILEQCHQNALELLRGKKDKLAEIADYLYNKETITGETFMQLLDGKAG
jgi:cell division protease FtsH